MSPCAYVGGRPECVILREERDEARARAEDLGTVNSARARAYLKLAEECGAMRAELDEVTAEQQRAYSELVAEAGPDYLRARRAELGACSWALSTMQCSAPAAHTDLGACADLPGREL